MPIQAAANRIKMEMASGKTRSGEGEKPTQHEILQQIGISEADCEPFKDSEHWLEFFPPKGTADLKRFGVLADWRRSFITTAKNPFFDSFVRWQFNALKAAGKVVYGKRYTIYSALDGQPCADHDRSTGEGVGTQEYVAIKIKLLALPESLSELAGKEVFLVAATLRPETMYGQTNCFVLPDGEYGAYRMKTGEYFVMSARAARNFAYQEMTEEFGKYPCTAAVTGRELIGLPLAAPLTSYKVVYALPMKSISMEKGTGIVTSVPSDAPDDWATLRDLQTKPKLREEYGIKEEWCMPFAPIEIIEIPEFGRLTAVTLVDQLNIKSQKDKDLLKQAKDKAYLKGFYEGRLLVGIAKGEIVEKAKPKVKQHLLEAGMAVPYYEPEKPVMSRTGDACIVASCYQWFLKYGEENWKEFVREHLSSENFNAHGAKTQHEFDLIIDWLKEWGCTRTQGLGTRLPWDDKFVIESLSDSTVYMAYYAVHHLLSASIDGTEAGPLGVKAEDLCDGCWDFVFRKGAYPPDCKVSLEHLTKMRHEFEYWYPMDLRCSGKDLIRNHLTMCLYNHAAIWEDQQMMPKSYFCNGYVILNAQKMSKSTGNFMTIGDCINEFGADATRLTMADAGDGLDDANFDSAFANAVLLKLFSLEKWIQDQIKLSIPDGSIDFQESKENGDLWDQIFENAVNNSIIMGTRYYDEMKYKQALKYAFFEINSIKEDYLIAKGGKCNPYTLMRYLEAEMVLINPIAPHFAQYCWNHYVYPVLSKSKNFGREVCENLCDQKWPVASAAVDKIAIDRLGYLKDTKSALRVGYDQAKSGGKKKAKGGKQPKKGEAVKTEEAKPVDHCVVFIANEYPEFQQKCLKILQGFEFDEENKIQGDHVTAIRNAFDKKEGGLAMKFVAFQLEIAKVSGKEAALRLESSFDERECIESNKAFLFENMGGIKDIKVVLNSSKEAKQYDGSQGPRSAAAPGKPAAYFHTADQVFLTEEQVAANEAAAASKDGGKKGKKGGKPEEAKQGAGGKKQDKKGKQAAAEPAIKERSFIMIKPDGVQRGLVGKIIQKFEQRAFKLVAMKVCQPGKEMFEQHYADLAKKAFFPGLVEYAASGPVCCMVWEGTNVVLTGRKMLGATKPFDSNPGTIRGDLCIDVGRNICHGSDSVESADKEIALWFKPGELVSWNAHSNSWVYE